MAVDEIDKAIGTAEQRTKAEEEAALRAQHDGWLDSNPFYLVIVLDDERNIEQDLGERGWIQKLSDSGFMRAPGTWYLVRKAGGLIVMMMLVNEGEQPYYVARHVGFVGVSGGASGETIIYGIGKKRLDGHTDRMWIMSNGCYLTGDDGEYAANRLLKQGILPSW